MKLVQLLRKKSADCDEQIYLCVVDRKSLGPRHFGVSDEKDREKIVEIQKYIYDFIFLNQRLRIAISS